jgi:hypothetical protein
MRPKARTDRLIVRELDGETLVYDERSHRAHCLNPVAALVWRSCDGETSVEQIARRVAAELGGPASDPIVWLALRRLRAAGLVAGEWESPRGISRRHVARQLGLTGAMAALLPVVASILAPTPAMAASGCGGSGASCSQATDPPCCDGFACVGGVCVPV